MAAVTLEGRSSPSIIFEPPKFVVKLTPDFGWSELSGALERYKVEVKGQWFNEAEISPKIIAFCEEIDLWLADPRSQTLDCREALDFWVKRVEEVDTNLDLPAISVIS